MTSRRWLIAAVLLLLAFWAVRLLHLNAFPPFVDEAFHVNFARNALRSSLLDHAEEGRQFVVWWFLAFGAQTSPHFWTARAAVLLVVLIGAAGALALGRMAAGVWGGIFAGLIYTFSAYHQFFERLALADPPSAALVIAAAAVAYRYRWRARPAEAIVVGVLLFLAVGAKVSALPYLIIPVATVIAHPRPPRVALRWLATALIPAFGLIGGYFALLYWRGRNPLMYLQSGGAAGTPLEIMANNLSNSFNTLSGYAGVIVAILLLVAMIGLLLRREWYLPLVLLIPYAALLLGARQASRHIIPVITLLLIGGGSALARLRLPKWVALLAIAAWGVVMGLPFVVNAPLDLPVTTRDRAEYINAEMSGFGIPETVALLESHGAERVIGILANCMTFKTLAGDRFAVECPRLNPTGEDVPALTNLLAANHDAYVVLEAVMYAPTSAPGTVIGVIETRQPALTIYAP